jgi:hypothetical protein
VIVTNPFILHASPQINGVVAPKGNVTSHVHKHRQASRVYCIGRSKFLSDPDSNSTGSPSSPSSTKSTRSTREATSARRLYGAVMATNGGQKPGESDRTQEVVQGSPVLEAHDGRSHAVDVRDAALQRVLPPDTTNAALVRAFLDRQPESDEGVTEHDLEMSSGSAGSLDCEREGHLRRSGCLTGTPPGR